MPPPHQNGSTRVAPLGGKIQQLVIRRSVTGARRGSVDCGPEDWPTVDHIAQPLPHPSTDAATHDLLNELRDMQVFLPPPAFPPEAAEEHGLSPGKDLNNSESRSPTSANGDDPYANIKRVMSSVSVAPDGSTVACGSPYRVLRVRLPTSDELPTYPSALASHFKEVSMATLRVMLYPRILLRQRLRQRVKLIEASKEQMPKLTPQFLNTVPLFKNWPPDAIQAVIKESRYAVYEPREYMAYQNEPPKAVYFVISGTCKLLTRIPKSKDLTHSTRLHEPGLPAAHVGGRGGGRGGAKDTGKVGRHALGGALQHAGAPTPVGNDDPDSPSHSSVLSFKSFAGSNCLPASLCVSPSVFGAINLLTNEPYGSALRSIGKVEAFVFSRSSFQQTLAMVPPQISQFTISTAFERRNERMRTRFPLTVETLKGYNLFSRVSNDFAEAIVDKVEPSALPTSFTLLHGGVICDAMYFIMAGKVGLYKNVADTTASSLNLSKVASMSSFRVQDRDDEVLVATVTGPALVGDAALMYNSANEYSVVSISDCDCYVLSKATFTNLCRQNPQDVDTMLDAARDQRKAELKTNHVKFRQVISNMPILCQLIEPYYERDFLNLFTPKSYRPMSCVCSTSEFCDRVMVLTKGKLRLGGGGGAAAQQRVALTATDGDGDSEDFHEMKRWESIGWSCCVPHRWGHTAMAMDKTVETLELSYMDFMTFLHDRGLLPRVSHMIRVLMFPRAHRKDVVQQVQARVGRHFPMYPISRSIHVNLYEMGFCSVHMDALADAEKRDVERVNAVKAAQAPSYRQLSQGIWVPKFEGRTHHHNGGFVF